MKQEEQLDRLGTVCPVPHPQPPSHSTKQQLLSSVMPSFPFPISHVIFSSTLCLLSSLLTPKNNNMLLLLVAQIYKHCILPKSSFMWHESFKKHEQKNMLICLSASSPSQQLGRPATLASISLASVFVLNLLSSS